MQRDFGRLHKDRMIKRVADFVISLFSNQTKPLDLERLKRARLAATHRQTQPKLLLAIPDNNPLIVPS